MEQSKQNSAVVITTIDENTGKAILTYIPMTLDAELMSVLLKNGSNCENKEAIYFELEESMDEFWKEFWINLKGDE